MRLLGRAVAAAMLLCVFALIWRSIEIVPKHVERDDGSVVDVSEATAVLTYRLQARQWLTFAVPSGHGRVKLLTNAIVAANQVRLPSGDSAGEPAPTYGYAVTYQLLGADDVIIEERQYHLSSRIEFATTPGADGHVSTNRLESGLGVVTAARAIQIPLTGRPDLRRVRVKLHTSDPNIETVVTRLYQIEPVLEHRLDQQWARLGFGARKRLARASVYGEARHLLTRAEKRNLIKNRWQPIGPERNDVLPLRIFIVDDEVAAPVPAFVQPNGWLVDADHDLVIGIDTEIAGLTLHYPDGTAADGVPVDIEWQGMKFWQSKTIATQSDPDARIPLRLDEGRVRLRSRQPIYVTAYDRAGEDVTPAERKLRVYLSDADGAVTYAIRHLDRRPTPFRLDLRQLVTAEVEHPSPPAEVIIDLLDEAGRHVGGERVKLAQPRSRLDRLNGPEADDDVTDVTRRYFALPSGVRSVRVSTASRVVVNAYTRPPGLPHLTSSASVERRATDAAPPPPVWFTLLPNRAADYRWNQRSALLVYQSRLLERRDALFDDSFEFERLRPVATDATVNTEPLWLGKYLLSKRDKEQPLSASAQASVFHPLPVDQTLDVTTMASMQAVPASRATTPTLAFHRPVDTPFHLTAELNGLTWFEGILHGRGGQLRLPSLPAGDHRVRLRVDDDHAEATRLYVAGLQSSVPSDDPRQRRLAYWLEDQPLVFEVDHEGGDDMVSIRAYADVGSATPFRFRATLEANRRQNTAFAQFSIKHRVFELTQTPPGDDGLMLDKHGRALGAGHIFYIAIGEDIEPGVVRIRLERESHGGGFVIPTRLRARDRTGRAYWVQRQVDEELDN